VPDTGTGAGVPATLISPGMRAAVGSVIRRRVSHPIATSDIRRWALAVYFPERPPWSLADSDLTVAPEEFNPFAWDVAELEDRGVDELDPDLIEASIGIPGPGLSFQLNGGVEVTYGERMRPGDVITSVERLAEYRERPGRLGTMLLTITEDTWTNQHGALVKVQRSTLIRY
jgi:hypothetical protein